MNDLKRLIKSARYPAGRGHIRAQRDTHVSGQL